MKKTAQLGCIIIFLLTMLFHLLVMVKIIPSDMVWGGRHKCQVELRIFRFSIAQSASWRIGIV